MKSPKVLIVEDEPRMVVGLRDNLEFEGYQVLVAGDGPSGLRKAIEDRPDLIILDVMLPGKSGLDVCRELRQSGSRTPVVMLSARGQELDKVVGLEVGADDYVTKPFGIQELLARVRAHLRRASGAVAEPDEYRFGEVELDFKRYRALRAGRDLQLSAKEFEILRYFVRRRGEAISRDELLNDVWSYDCFPITRTVDNHIAKLRQKIEPDPADPRYIITIHRVGYKFIG